MPKMVFVMDDKQVSATVIGAILRNSGFEPKSFTNPLEALAAAEDINLSILILDLAMPQMHGIEFAFSSNKYPVCCILLLSGQATTLDQLERAQRKGHDFSSPLQTDTPEGSSCGFIA